MTGRSDVERALDLFLAPDHDRLPDRVVEAALTEISDRSQARRGPFAPWRHPVNLKLTRWVVLAALALGVGGVGLLLLGGGSSRTPSPAPSPSAAAATPSAAASPGVDAPFGYTGAGTIEYTTHDPSGNDTLWIVDPSGANARELVPGGCCGLFSPDGTLLAVAAPGVRVAGTRRDSSLLGIEVLDHPGLPAKFTIPTGCTSCAVLGLNYAPDAWSPNGRFVALDMWSDADPTQAGMGLADRDFPTPWDWGKVRTTGNHPDLPVAFSPDSSMLLFMRTERTDGPSSIGPLYLLQIGGGIRQISPPGVTVSTNGLIQWPASWSPDGKTIVFAGVDASTGRTNLYAAGATVGTAARILVPDVQEATSARYSTDGSLIAFDQLGQTAGGPHDLFVMKADGSDLTNLTASFEPGVCCGVWSPDGQALLVAGTSSDDDHNLLYIVKVDGSGIWQVTATPGVTTAFAWSPSFGAKP